MSGAVCTWCKAMDYIKTLVEEIHSTTVATIGADGHPQTSCYSECLKLAADTGVETIAFCCLSTGVFRFPQLRAAEIATATVKTFLENDDRIKKVVFNVFKDVDLKIYRSIL